MSIQAVAWVLEHSESTKGARCVLFAVANHADQDGRNSWPSVATIAHEARLSERAAQYALRQLEEDGELRQTGTHKSGTRVYELPKMGVQDLRGVQPVDEGGASDDIGGVQKPLGGVQPTAPEPSLEPSKGNRPEPSTSRPEIETLCELLAEQARKRTESSKIKVTQTWRTEMRRLIDLDGRTPEQIEYVINFVDRSSFWGRNVLSVPTLRKQFDRLVAEIKGERGDRGNVREHPASRRIRERMGAAPERPTASGGFGAS